MNCPHCDTTMRRIEYERIPICTCPDCNGAFLDYKRLRAIEKRQEIEVDAARGRRLKSTPTGPTQEVKISCPRCGNTMSKIYYPDTKVVIDYCRACRGIWLDDKELEKIQVLAEEKTAKDPGQSEGFGAFASTMAGARVAAREQPGASTEGQGYVAEPGVGGASMSTPRLWVRLVSSCLFLAFAVAWFSGVVHTLIPVERWFEPDTLEKLDIYLPVISAFMAFAFAFSFTKVTVQPKREVEVKKYFLGIPWTRRHPKNKIKYLATDYDSGGSFFKNIVLSSIVDYMIWGMYGGWLRPREYTSGTSYLYIVLKSGKRIRIYKGKNDTYLGNLADFLRSGLGVKIRRI